MSKIKKVSVSELKVHALHLIESVKTSKTEIEVYKHGKLVAKIMPVEENPKKSILGSLTGSATFSEDPDSLLEPIDVKWDANEE
jgi:prevent-host-death family protein